MQHPQRIVEDKVYNDWQFDTIEHTSQIREHGINIKVYNCLEEYQDGVRLGYKATAAEAKVFMQNAVKKLVKLRLQSYLSKNIKNNDLISLSMSLKFNDSKDSIISKAIDLSFFTENELPYCQKSFEALYK